MKVEIVDTKELNKQIKNTALFLRRLDDEAIIVRHFMPESAIDAIKANCIKFSNQQASSWHPCLDGCPDYHRIHDQYPKAHVKSTQHAYYYHPWNQNGDLFNNFLSIFHLKCKLSGGRLQQQNVLFNTPSNGPIARVLVHQYPRGGGGQEEHIDPVAPFAKVQTIIQASVPGVDYKKGGLYINHDKYGLINIDKLTRKGDLILASPGVRHGVAKVDPETSLDWTSPEGRWIIMPIIIYSDLVTGANTKPLGKSSNN